MFKNIGTKIKSMALIFCIIGIVMSCISGIIIMFFNFIIGLIAALFGSFISWLSILALYGIGEAAESSNKVLSILNNQTTTLFMNTEAFKISRKLTISESAKGKLSKFGITFVPSIGFKNVFATASQLESIKQTVSCLELGRESLEDEQEKIFISSILTLSTSAMKQIVKSIDGIITNQ